MSNHPKPLHWVITHDAILMLDVMLHVILYTPNNLHKGGIFQRPQNKQDRPFRFYLLLSTFCLSNSSAASVFSALPSALPALDTGNIVFSCVMTQAWE